MSWKLTLILDTHRWPDEIVGELGMRDQKNKNLYSTGDQAEKLKKKFPRLIDLDLNDKNLGAYYTCTLYYGFNTNEHNTVQLPNIPDPFGKDYSLKIIVV